MIVFFRTSRLIKQLRDNSVPEFHKFLYLFLPFLLSYTLGTSEVGVNDFLTGSHLSTIEIVDFIFDIILFVAGSFFLWQINQAGDGESFIERYVCLRFPAGVIVNIIGFFIGILPPFLMSVVLKYQDQELLNSYMYIKTIALDINGIIYYALMAIWMKRTSQK